MADLFDFIDAPASKKSGDIFDSLGGTPDYVPPEIAQSEAQQAIEQNFRAPQWANNAAEALQGTLGGFVPRSMHDVAGLLTPATGSIDEVIKAARIAKDVANGATPEEATRQHSPESFQLADAGETPPYSKERFQAGFDTVAQMLMAAGIAKGHAKAGEVPKPETVLKPSDTELRNQAEAVPAVPPESTTQRTSDYKPQQPPVESTIPQPEHSTSAAQREAEKASSVSDAPAANPQGEFPPKANPEPQPASDTTGQTTRFVPSTEWQEVPPGTVLPNGGEYRMDQKSGKNYARWSPENLPVEPTARKDSQPASAQASPPTQVPPVESQTFSNQEQLRNPREVPRPENTPTSEEPSTVGIARRFVEEDIEKGVLPPEALVSGEGWTPEKALARGRDLINKGVDPRVVTEALKGNRRFPPGVRDAGDAVAVLHAERERLAAERLAAQEAASARPNDSALASIASNAEKAEVEFLRTAKPQAGGLAQRIMVAFQEAHPVDLSTFDGLYRKALDLSEGRELAPGQKAELARRANKAQNARRAEVHSLDRLQQEMDRTLPRRKLPTEQELAAEVEKMVNELTPCR